MEKGKWNIKEEYYNKKVIIFYPVYSVIGTDIGDTTGFYTQNFIITRKKDYCNDPVIFL